MTALDALDATGAAFLVNVLVDVIQIGQRLKRGEIAADEFPKLFWAATKDRAVYTALATGSLWAVGSIGLLVPIVVRRMVAEDALQRQTLDAWNKTTEAMCAELKARAKHITLLGEIQGQYRKADGAAEANNQLLDAATADLRTAGRLLGRSARPGSTSNGVAAA